MRWVESSSPCTRCSEDIDSALQSRQPVVGPSYSHATGRTLAGPARSPGGGGREELGGSVAGSVACVGGRRAARSSSRIIARIPLSVSGVACSTSLGRVSPSESLIVADIRQLVEAADSVFLNSDSMRNE